MEGVEKILPVRSTFEEIQNLFLNRISRLQPRNVMRKDY